MASRNKANKVSDKCYDANNCIFNTYFRVSPMDTTTSYNSLMKELINIHSRR